MNKKELTILIVTASVLITGATALIIWQLTKDKAAKKNKAKKTTTETKTGKSANETNSLPNATWPLMKGSVGKEVMYVNMALGLAPSAEFSELTENTLYAKFKVKQVSKSSYDYFIHLNQLAGNTLPE